MTQNYAVDDGNGNQLTAGLTEHNVRRVAQSLANDRAESVWYYETGEGEEEAESVEVEPDRGGKERQIGTAHNTPFLQDWLNRCDAVIRWREISSEVIEFAYDPAIEVLNVPAGVDFEGGQQ